MKFYKLKNYPEQYLLGNYFWFIEKMKEVNEKEKEKRLSFFKRHILTDRTIDKIKKEDGKTIITYKNGQIFKCSGWIVDQTIL
jgi:hypothetical protein